MSEQTDMITDETGVVSRFVLNDKNLVEQWTRNVKGMESRTFDDAPGVDWGLLSISTPMAWFDGIKCFVGTLRAREDRADERAKRQLYEVADTLSGKIAEILGQHCVNTEAMISNAFDATSVEAHSNSIREALGVDVGSAVAQVAEIKKLRDGLASADAANANLDREIDVDREIVARFEKVFFSELGQQIVMTKSTAAVNLLEEYRLACARLKVKTKYWDGWAK